MINYIKSNSAVGLIIVFFVIRLIFTTQPPIEYQHTWRQSTGLMYARNFVEVDQNILRPRIDDNAGGTGILILEAPIMYYGMYLFSLPFGYQDWYGRLINLIISSLGLFYFYLLIKMWQSKKIAFYATALLITSVWFSFSRKTMQDSFAFSLMFIGIYYGIRYLKPKGQWLYLIYYLIFTSLAMLAKIPAVIYLLVPFLYLLKFKPNQDKIVAWFLASLFPVLLSYGWYFLYAPYATQKYGYWYNLGESFSDGLQSLMSNGTTLLERFFFDGNLSFVAIALFLAGWYIMIKSQQRERLIVISSLTVIFFLYMIKSGKYFIWHNYYMIPYAPIFSIVAAITLAHIQRKKIALILMSICMLEGIGFQARDFTASPKNSYKLALKNYVSEYTEPSDKIVLLNYGNPIGFYFAHRKGWLQTEKEKLPDEKLNQMTEGGAKILIINQNYVDHTYDLPLLVEDENYRIYDLKSN